MLLVAVLAVGFYLFGRKDRVVKEEAAVGNLRLLFEKVDLLSFLGRPVKIPADEANYVIVTPPQFLFDAETGQVYSIPLQSIYLASGKIISEDQRQLAQNGVENALNTGFFGSEDLLEQIRQALIAQLDGKINPKGSRTNPTYSIFFQAEADAVDNGQTAYLETLKQVLDSPDAKVEVNQSLKLMLFDLNARGLLGKINSSLAAIVPPHDSPPPPLARSGTFATYGDYVKHLRPDFIMIGAELGELMEKDPNKLGNLINDLKTPRDWWDGMTDPGGKYSGAQIEAAKEITRITGIKTAEQTYLDPNSALAELREQQAKYEKWKSDREAFLQESGQSSPLPAPAPSDTPAPEKLERGIVPPDIPELQTNTRDKMVQPSLVTEFSQPETAPETIKENRRSAPPAVIPPNWRDLPDAEAAENFANSIGYSVANGGEEDSRTITRGDRQYTFPDSKSFIDWANQVDPTGPEYGSNFDLMQQLYPNGPGSIQESLQIIKDVKLPTQAQTQNQIGSGNTGGGDRSEDIDLSSLQQPQKEEYTADQIQRMYGTGAKATGNGEIETTHGNFKLDSETGKYASSDSSIFHSGSDSDMLFPSAFDEKPTGNLTDMARKPKDKPDNWSGEKTSSAPQTASTETKTDESKPVVPQVAQGGPPQGSGQQDNPYIVGEDFWKTDTTTEIKGGSYGYGGKYFNEEEKSLRETVMKIRAQEEGLTLNPHERSDFTADQVSEQAEKIRELEERTFPSGQSEQAFDYISFAREIANKSAQRDLTDDEKKFIDNYERALNKWENTNTKEIENLNRQADIKMQEIQNNTDMEKRPELEHGLDMLRLNLEERKEYLQHLAQEKDEFKQIKDSINSTQEEVPTASEFFEEGNGEGKTPYKKWKEEMITKCFEYDEATKDIKLKDNWQDNFEKDGKSLLKGVNKEIELDSKKRIADILKNNDMMTPGQVKETMKRGQGIRVSNGTKTRTDNRDLEVNTDAKGNDPTQTKNPIVIPGRTRLVSGIKT